MSDWNIIFLLGILGTIEILIMAVGVFCLEIQQSKIRRMILIGSVLLNGIMEVLYNLTESDLVMFLNIIITPLSFFVGLKSR